MRKVRTPSVEGKRKSFDTGELKEMKNFEKNTQISNEDARLPPQVRIGGETTHMLRFIATLRQITIS